MHKMPLLVWQAVKMVVGSLQEVDLGLPREDLLMGSQVLGWAVVEDLGTVVGL
jgi:hypothetical protein